MPQNKDGWSLLNEAMQPTKTPSLPTVNHQTHKTRILADGKGNIDVLSKIHTNKEKEKIQSKGYFLDNMAFLSEKSGNFARECLG